MGCDGSCKGSPVSRKRKSDGVLEPVMEEKSYSLQPERTAKTRRLVFDSQSHALISDSDSDS